MGRVYLQRAIALCCPKDPLASHVIPDRSRLESGLGRVTVSGRDRTQRDRIRGLAVHIGARVSALARSGEVLVSSTVKDLTASSGLQFEDAGEHELKGIPERWHLYRVLAGATS